MKRPILAPALLVAGAHSLFAHAGPHHDTGLPDFAAHFYLGLQCLAIAALPIAAFVFFLRSPRRSKTRTLTSKKLDQ
jgi:hypothetical protein